MFYINENMDRHLDNNRWFLPYQIRNQWKGSLPRRSFSEYCSEIAFAGSNEITELI